MINRIVIEGTPFLQRSNNPIQSCVCCEPGTGHIFSRSLTYNGLTYEQALRTLLVPSNEDKRFRVTIEVL